MLALPSLQSNENGTKGRAKINEKGKDTVEIFSNKAKKSEQSKLDTLCRNYYFLIREKNLFECLEYFKNTFQRWFFFNFHFYFKRSQVL